MIKTQRLIIVSLLLLTALLLTNVHAGWFFKDPVEITPQPVKHVWDPDELHFTLTGKSKLWMVLQPEVTLELRSSTGIHKLILAQRFWTVSEPLKFKLPVRYSDLNSFTLKGKFLIIGEIKPNPKGKYPLPDGGRIDLIPVEGYKIDSRWTTK